MINSVVMSVLLCFYCQHNDDLCRSRFWMRLPISKPSPFAICIDNTQYPASLEMHKVYRVLRDDSAQRDGDLRVIDESGEDYLFPAEMFLLVTFPQGIQRTLQQSFASA